MAATNALEATGMGLEQLAKGLAASAFTNQMSNKIDQALAKANPPPGKGVLLYTWVHIAKGNSSMFRDPGASVSGYYSTRDEAIRASKSMQNMHAIHNGYSLVWAYDFLPPGNIKNPLQGLSLATFVATSGCHIL